jgi:hypothetical protein
MRLSHLLPSPAMQPWKHFTQQQVEAHESTTAWKLEWEYQLSLSGTGKIQI